MKSPAYWHPLIYDLSVTLFWRKRPRVLRAIWNAVAEYIPDDASVLEIGAGTGLFYRNVLRQKRVRYSATDINPAFVRYLRRIGVEATVSDIRSQEPADADVIVALQVLYNFRTLVPEVLSKMVNHARRHAIVVEPVSAPLRRAALRDIIRAWSVDIGEGPIFDRLSRDDLHGVCSRAGRIVEWRELPDHYQLVVLKGQDRA